MDVRTVLPCQVTSRGSPAFKEISFMMKDPWSLEDTSPKSFQAYIDSQRATNFQVTRIPYPLAGTPLPWKGCPPQWPLPAPHVRLLRSRLPARIPSTLSPNSVPSGRRRESQMEFPLFPMRSSPTPPLEGLARKIGRASCRERVEIWVGAQE